MPFHASCPGCRTTYSVPDASAGRRLRCKRCQTAFTAEPVPRVAVTTRPAAAPRVVARREEQADAPPPARPAHLPWVVGGIVAGAVLLVFCAALVVLITMAPRRPAPVAADAPV